MSNIGRVVAAGAAAVISIVIVAAIAFLRPDATTPWSAAATTAAPAAGDLTAHGGGARTLAGTGAPGFSGDGRSALDARLDAPAGIAESRTGNLYIADAGNCRVREVPGSSGVSFGLHVRAGHIVTIAGGPCSGPKVNPAPSALAVDAAGDLFIAYGPADRVEELPARSGAAFGAPVSAGRSIAVAGTGVPGFRGDGGRAATSALDDPTGVAVDAAGDLLIADTANCRLRVVAATSGTRFGVAMVEGHIYTVAGDGTCGSAGDGGPALHAELWDPGALAVDPHGDVVVADQGNRTIRLLAAQAGTFYGVALATGDLGTVAGEGSYGPYLVDGLAATGETAEINFPAGVAVAANGDLFIADGAMQAIRIVPGTAGTLLGRSAQPDDMYTVAGAVSTGSLDNRTTWVQTRMLEPTGLALSTGGRLVYSDSEANVVRELPAGL